MKYFCVLYLTLCLAITAVADDSCTTLSSNLKSAQPIKNEIELLAIAISGELMADQAVYDRLDKDIAAMRSLEPKLTTISYRPRDDGKSILITATSTEDRDALLLGKDSTWNCLNNRFRVTSATAISPTLIHLNFGIFINAPKVAKLYAAIPKVAFANRNSTMGDGSTICVTRQDDTWHYVFDIASGDCPAGCTNHKLFYYFSKATGEPLQGGYWESTPKLELPQWADRYWKQASCRH